MRPTKSRSAFTRFTKWTAHATGRPFTFLLACALIVAWAVTGPLFGFSDTWQLVINTSTTIITFLMVFLIQSTQNRDSEAMQVKLDEIIRAIGNAKNELLDLEELEEKELEAIRDTYLKMAATARDELRARGRDAGPSNREAGPSSPSSKPRRTQSRNHKEHREHKDSGHKDHEGSTTKDTKITKNSL